MTLAAATAAIVLPLLLLLPPPKSLVAAAAAAAAAGHSWFRHVCAGGMLAPAAAWPGVHEPRALTTGPAVLVQVHTHPAHMLRPLV